MKQLPNFDLSIVILLGDRLETFTDSLSFRKEYYERNGIEVILLVDGRMEYSDLLACIRKYPFISWKVIVNSVECPWKNQASAYNEGIGQATKQYILFLCADFDFQADVIYELRKDLDEYPQYYAKDSYYGFLMVKKEYLNLIGGYDERFDNWEGNEENLCRRLELSGIRRLNLGNTISQNEKSCLSDVWSQSVPAEIISEMLLPTIVNARNTGFEGFSTVVYDWQEHPYAKEQCREYLSGLEQYDIPADNVFDKSYPLIALIPTYNESERITDCLCSVEKYCDGIILLDDDSSDNTYELVQSDKLLLKAKKVRTEFNDKQNRNILLDLASFFKAEWFIFIDADERFDERFVDLRKVMKRDDVDTVGVWIANLWDSMETYRTDMEDRHPLSQNGLWFRWRMFRNKGWNQLQIDRRLHFSTVPYCTRGKECLSKSLLLHYGYLGGFKRRKKYDFYQVEDSDKILCYDSLLCENSKLSNICDIKLNVLGIGNDI